MLGTSSLLKGKRRSDKRDRLVYQDRVSKNRGKLCRLKKDFLFSARLICINIERRGSGGYELSLFVDNLFTRCLQPGYGGLWLSNMGNAKLYMGYEHFSRIEN